MLEHRYGNNYKAMIYMVSLGLCGGDPNHVALVSEELHKALTNANANPCRETWEQLKEAFIKDS